MPDEPIPTPFPTPANPAVASEPQASFSPFRQALPVAPVTPDGPPPAAVKPASAKSPVVLSLIGVILLLVVLIIAFNQPKRSATTPAAIEKLKLETALETERNRSLRLQLGLPAFEPPVSTVTGDVSQRLSELERQLDSTQEEISVLKLRVRELENRR